MSIISLEFNNVWKKFKRGEKYDSLRDLIPSITKSIFKKSNNNVLHTKEFWALKDVSFQIKKGEAWGIIGPNGAGKSTILKLLSGILKPTKGKITTNGKISALIEVSAGFHPDLTGLENIYLNGSILGMTKKEIDKKLEEIVEFSGLKEFLNTPVKRYSSGMYARLGFSVAAHVDPDILLIDEVLSVGDMKFQQKCLEKMISIKKNGTTIIFISHNLESVNTLCPKAIFLENGTIKKIGNTVDVIKEYVTSSRELEENSHQDHTITDVILLNKNDKPCVNFVPGEKAKIILKIKANKFYNDCLLGFIINRVTDGITVCDYNLHLPTNKISFEKEMSLSIEFDVNLLRGVYTISLHVLHHPSARFLCWARNILTFTVDEMVSWQGCAHLNPILSKI